MFGLNTGGLRNVFVLLHFRRRIHIIIPIAIKTNKLTESKMAGTRYLLTYLVLETK